MSSLALLLAGCQTLPNVKFYKEIPFIDAPEAIYVESVTRKRGMLSAAEYAKRRPFMLMLDPEGVQEILKNWKKQCRQEEDACTVQLESVSSLIKAIDDASKNLLQSRP